MERLFIINKFFPFSILKIFYCCLACKVSAEKPTYSFMGAVLCVTSHFALATFKIFSLSLICDNLTVVCLKVTLLRVNLFGVSRIFGP